MPHHSHNVDLDALYDDGEALRDALLSQDLDEARFRAGRMASMTGRLGLGQVAHTAQVLAGALGEPGEMPAERYAQAVFSLSDALSNVVQGRPE